MYYRWPALIAYSVFVCILCVYIVFTYRKINFSSSFFFFFLFVLYCLQLRLIPYQMTVTETLFQFHRWRNEHEPNFWGSFSISSCDVPALCTGWLHSTAHSLSFRSGQRRRVPAAPRRVDRSRHQGRPAATLLFAVLNNRGDIRMLKVKVEK